MSNLDEPTQANMDVVLEEVCRVLSKHCGDHESKDVAERLMGAARAGKRTLQDLRCEAERALLDLAGRRSA